MAGPSLSDLKNGVIERVTQDKQRIHEVVHGDNALVSSLTELQVGIAALLGENTLLKAAEEQMNRLKELREIVGEMLDTSAAAGEDSDARKQGIERDVDRLLAVSQRQPEEAASAPIFQIVENAITRLRGSVSEVAFLPAKIEIVLKSTLKRAEADYAKQIGASQDKLGELIDQFVQKRGGLQDALKAVYEHGRENIGVYEQGKADLESALERLAEIDEEFTAAGIDIPAIRAEAQEQLEKDRKALESALAQELAAMDRDADDYAVKVKGAEASYAEANAQKNADAEAGIRKTIEEKIKEVKEDPTERNDLAALITELEVFLPELLDHLKDAAGLCQRIEDALGVLALPEDIEGSQNAVRKRILEVLALKDLSEAISYFKSVEEKHPDMADMDEDALDDFFSDEPNNPITPAPPGGGSEGADGAAAQNAAPKKKVAPKKGAKSAGAKTPDKKGSSSGRSTGRRRKKS